MRVEVAVAIIHNPKILYLDEPTIGLDIIAKKQIRNFIKELNNKYNTTIVLTSHDMQDIEMLCNRILVINCGKIVVDEEVKDLKHMYNQDIKIKIDFNEPVTLSKLEIENLKCECIDKKGYIWQFTLLNNTQELTMCLNKIVSIGTIEKIEILEKNVEEIISEIYDKEI
jgi:ABC-2 type transport system ATP-binding protein